jgi:hypothetical protein
VGGDCNTLGLQCSSLRTSVSFHESELLQGEHIWLLSHHMIISMHIPTIVIPISMIQNRGQRELPGIELAASQTISSANFFILLYNIY